MSPIAVVTSARGAWIAFVVAHSALVLLGVADVRLIGFEDVVSTYLPWAADWFAAGPRVGIDEPWVYPAAALPAILLPALLGTGSGYVIGWSIMVVAVDAAAFAVARSRSPVGAAWWLLLLLALGPVSIGRIDAVATALAIPGLLLLGDRPRLAGALLGIGAWIKVWPAALLLAVLAVGGRARARVVVGASVATLAVVAAAITAGGAPHLLTFVAAQSTRGLQIEAPLALPVLWAGALGNAAVHVAFDPAIITWEVSGPGAGVAAAIASLLQVVAVAAVLVLGARALARGSGRVVLPLVALGVVAALIAFNKVGSPQYVGWLAAPVVLGLAADPLRFRIPAAGVVALALLTQVVSAAFGSAVLRAVIDLQVWALVPLSVRDAGELVLLAWCIRALRQEQRRPDAVPVPAASPPGVLRS